MDISTPAPTPAPAPAHPARQPADRRALRRLTTAAIGSGVAAASATLTVITGSGTPPPDSQMGWAPLSGISDLGYGVVLAVVAAILSAGVLLLRRWVSRPGGAPPPRTSILIGGGLVTLAALVVAIACDAMPLASAGYLPLLTIGALVSPGMRADLAVVAQPALLVQFVVMALALLVVFAVIRALGVLGDPADRPAWLTPAGVTRWSAGAVVVAAFVPLLYAFTRIVWALGWPLGIELDEVEQVADLNAGLVLAAGAIVGALLTIGLIRPWGQRFWAWLPLLGGRSVPVWLAVVPASVVAAMLLPAGVSMIGAMVRHTGPAGLDLVGNWAAGGPVLLWPMWSLALAAATLGYAIRRAAPAAKRAGSFTDSPYDDVP